MGSNQSKAVEGNYNSNDSNVVKSNETKNNLSSSSNNEIQIPNDSIHQNVTATGGGCPMKKSDGGYMGGGGGISGWLGLGTSSKKNRHENDAGRTTNNTTCTTTATATATSKGDTITYTTGGGCPVRHYNKKPGQEGTQYNVYSQPIDPSNNMPSVANQLPSPFQTQKLSTTRVQSSIPKGSKGSSNHGSEEEEEGEGDSTSSASSTWTYPSPQMFYNSLARKNKLGDTTEEDIESVVAMHNNMNEKTWAKVIEWEETLLGKEQGQESKLLKFMGRPSDLSPKAQLKNMIFGHPLPFDRHDWTVIRKDGTEVRYVIDYYHDESRASDSEESAMPALNDYNAVKSILVDVRPAADDVHSVYGRMVTMPMARHLFKSSKFQPLPILPTNELKSQIGESEKVWANIQKDVQESKSKSMILKKEDIPEDQRDDDGDGNDDTDHSNLPQMSDDEAKEVATSFAKMIGQCQNAQKIVDKCKDEAECAKASLALTMCLAKVVCPLQQGAVAEALNDDAHVDMNDEKAVEVYNARFDKALENMAICVNAKSQRAAIARQTHPHLFKDL